MVSTKTKIFCVVNDYAEKADLSKGCWDPKRELGVLAHFSEITKLWFWKKKKPTLLHVCIFELFRIIVVGKKCAVTPTFFLDSKRPY